MTTAAVWSEDKMPQIDCPSCGHHILYDDEYFDEYERRIEAQRRTAKRLSEQSKEAASLVEQGWPTRRIARHFGVTTERARRLAQPGGFFANRIVDQVAVLRLYREGLPASQIAKRVSCHPATVYRIIREVETS